MEPTAESDEASLLRYVLYARKSSEDAGAQARPSRGKGDERGRGGYYSRINEREKIRRGMSTALFFIYNGYIGRRIAEWNYCGWKPVLTIRSSVIC